MKNKEVFIDMGAHFGNLTDDQELMGRKNLLYKEWNKTVREKDSHQCQNCGYRKGSLHAHHKRTFRSDETGRYEFLNGKLLCKQCHYKEHFGEDIKKQEEKMYVRQALKW